MNRIKRPAVSYDTWWISWEVRREAMIDQRDLFWRLFQRSGHIGAYLLYAWHGGSRESHGAESQRAAACGEAEDGDTASVTSVNGRKGDAAQAGR